MPSFNLERDLVWAKRQVEDQGKRQDLEERPDPEERHDREEHQDREERPDLSREVHLVVVQQKGEY